MAFVYQHRQKNRAIWKIGWEDATKGAGKSGRRYATCIGGNHRAAFDAAGVSPDERAAFAQGAHTNQLRRKLLRCYDRLERVKREEAARAGGYGHGSRFETPLTDLLAQFREQLKDEATIRRAGKGRTGRAAGTAESYSEALDKLVCRC
jgi:hypothetical protein